MKRTSFKPIILIYIVVLFCFPLTAASSSGDMQDSIEAYAEEVERSFKEKSDVSTESEPVSGEYLERNYSSIETYNTIINHVNDNDDELRYHYAGSYINDDGFLVVLLSCDSDHCIEFVKEDLHCTDVIFSKGEGSWYETQKKLNIINQRIAECSFRIYNKEKVSYDTELLMSTYPHTVYNDMNNSITIVFNINSGNKGILGDKFGCLSDDAILENLISLFSSVIGNHEQINYAIEYEEDPFVDDCAVSWRPGRAIFVYKSEIQYWVPLSSGYRATYAFGGTTYHGYVTAGHTTEIGDTVYVYSGTTSFTQKLGVINFRTECNDLDVSYFRFNNIYYYDTNSNAIYYTSSQPGVTTQGTVLDGTQCDVPGNALIYKSGQTTYLTWGYVYSTSIGYYSDSGIYFYDMIQADRNMCESGDSGGITYIISNAGATQGKAVGIVKGHHDYLSTFVKARNIRDSFHAYVY